MDHRLIITQEDFELFNRVLKVVYNDLNYLLLKHKVVHIAVKEDGRIYFNQSNTGIVLSNQHRALRTILNFYFFCIKHGAQFRNAAFNDKLEGADWYKEYKTLLEAINKLELKGDAQQKMFPRR